MIYYLHISDICFVYICFSVGASMMPEFCFWCQSGTF